MAHKKPQNSYIWPTCVFNSVAEAVILADSNLSDVLLVGTNLLFKFILTLVREYYAKKTSPDTYSLSENILFVRRETRKSLCCAIIFLSHTRHLYMTSQLYRMTSCFLLLPQNCMASRERSSPRCPTISTRWYIYISLLFIDSTLTNVSQPNSSLGLFLTSSHF